MQRAGTGRLSGCSANLEVRLAGYAYRWGDGRGSAGDEERGVSDEGDEGRAASSLQLVEIILTLSTFSRGALDAVDDEEPAGLVLEDVEELLSRVPVISTS
jgi:hypothetical protein